MNCILHNVFSIKDCVTAAVIDSVVLGRRFLSLDCLYKDVHVLRRKCFIVYKEVLCMMYSFADVWKYVLECVGMSGMILGVVEVISIARVHCVLGELGEKRPQMPA